MQQPPPMIPIMPSFPPANITTEQIQKYLDENKKLILAILEHQNLGKLAECAQYQAQLQKNLMYLAAIADAQPQASAMAPQMAPHPAMQQGGFYMQHPQAAPMTPQQGIFPPKMPIQFNTPPQHQMQEQPQQHQAMQGQMGVRPGGAASNGMHPGPNEAALGGGSSVGPPPTSAPSDGNKQGNPSAGTDAQTSSAVGPEDAK